MMFCVSPVKLLQTEENPEAIFNCLHRFPFNNPPRAGQTFCRDGSEVLALHETEFLICFIICIHISIQESLRQGELMDVDQVLPAFRASRLNIIEVLRAA